MRSDVIGMALCGAFIVQGSFVAPSIAQTSTGEETDHAAAAAPGPHDGGEAGDIIVTAQRRSQTLIEVPISVSVLPAATIERQAIVDTRQLVQLSPAVTFSEGSADRGGSFNIRGISSTAQEGGIQPSLALVIDGVPIARQGEFISTFLDVQQIEVLSGPQGTLFGKNATAGVINILTKDPTDAFELTGQADYTTDDQIILRSTVNLPLAEGVRLRVNGVYDDQSPVIRNIGIGGELGAARTYAFAGKLALDVAPGVDIMVQGDYRNRRSSYGSAMILVPISGALGELQQQAMGVPIGRGVDVTNQDAVSLTKSEGWSVAGTLNWQVADHWKLTSITAYREYEFDNSVDIDAGPVGWRIGRGFSPNPVGYPIGYVDRGLPRQPSHAQYFSQELRLAYSDGPIDLIVGGFYQNYKEQLRGSSPFFRNGFYIDGAALTAGYRDRTGALFGDITYEIADPVKVFAGLRYNAETLRGNYVRTPYNYPIELFDPVTGANGADPVARFAYRDRRTDHDLSGRAGIQYLPTSRQNYYLSFNRGFKGAAIDVSSAWVTGAPIFAKPEIATAFELGTRQTILDGRLFFAASIYRQTVENVQQATVVPNSTTLATQLQNAGDIRTRGGEFQFSWKTTPDIRLSGGVAYTHARYRGGVVACNVSQAAGEQGGCTLDINEDGVAESQSLTGKRAKETPEWAFNTAVDYDREIASGARIFGRVAAVYVGKIQYQLLNDPLTIEPSHWLVDASIGYETPDGRWRISLFGKNLTNDFYYGNIGQTDGFIGRAWARIARDSKRYGGISVRTRW